MTGSTSPLRYSSANPPNIGDRVKIAPMGVIGYTRTGRVSDLRFFHEIFARIILECGGAEPSISLPLLTPAPMICEWLNPPYKEGDIRSALRRLLLRRLGAELTLRDTASRMGVNVTTINNWNKSGKIPLERMQQLADVLGVSAEDVRALLEAEAPVPAQRGFDLPVFFAPAYGSA